MKKYATYVRVSTQKQGNSGLGLEAQQRMCKEFIERNGGEQVAEFKDVESGTHRNRKGLWEAIDYCNKNGCSLVIAKLDRLARDVEFTFKVINTGIDIHFTDMPVVNTMILGVFASVSQYERELISTRTKAALSEKKRRGEKLGAASDTYSISDEKLKERGRLAADTRKRHALEKRDTVALIKIMKRVFPECASHPESEWEHSFVNTKADTRRTMLQMMKDLKDLDESGKLFVKWDLSDFDNYKLQQRLASRMQTIINMLNS